MFFKSIIFLLIIFLLNPPLNNIFDFLTIGILIVIYFGINKNNNLINIYSKKKKYVLFIFIILLTKIYLPKFEINEAHSVFLNFNDLNEISNIVPEKIINDIKIKYKKFDLEKFYKAEGEITEIEFSQKKYIDKAFAYSSDGFLQNKKFSRITDNINFNSREKLRLEHFNSINFNFAYDKHFRREMPYYVLFEIPTLAQGSSICSEGEVFYYFSKDEINIHNIKNINFSKFKNDCMFLDNNNNFFYILGYSINKLDNLKIYLDKNLLLKIISISKIFLNLILIFLIIHTCFEIKFNKTCLIYLISFLATIIIAMLKDTNLITGLRFFRGGADGLNYYSLGRDILSNFEKGNFLLALRGGSDIFYFMPGQRYFSAISNFIFGATSYGYLLITSILPTIFYIFFKKYLNEKTAVLLFVLFVFFPIFENLGFGYYNYIHQVFRNHAETLSILLILLSFITVVDFEKKQNLHIFEIFSIGLLLSLAAILRPNFFLTTSLIFLYVTYFLFIKKKYLGLSIFFISYFTFLSCLAHNLYFGERFVLFTNAFVEMNFPISLEIYFIGVYNMILFNFENLEFQIMINHLSRWNPIYNIHRIAIFAFVIFYFLKKKQSSFNYLLILCMLLQQGLLFLSNPDSRYAYLAWLLLFILFINIFIQSNLFHNLKSIIPLKMKVKID